MELKQGIQGRRSIRKFQDQPVSHEILKEVIETAAYAPSWKNTQTAGYLVVESRELLEKLSSADCVMGFSHNSRIIAQTPALVILTTETGYSGYEKDGSFSTSKEDRWEAFDAGIAAQTFCLAAYEKGLGTVILGIFDEKQIADKISLPEGKQIAALIAVGYPAEEPKAPRRKTAEELLHFL